MSLRAPFPWFASRSCDPMRVSRADAERFSDGAQGFSVATHATRSSYLRAGQSGATVSPLRCHTPRSASPVRVGVLDILRRRRKFQIGQSVVSLIEIKVIDLKAVGDGSVMVRPHDSMRADTAQFAINPQHQAQITFSAIRFGSSREWAGVVRRITPVPPYLPVSVNAQGAVCYQRQRAIEGVYRHV